MTMGEVMCVIEDPAPQRVMRSLSGHLFFCSGKARPCLLVVKEVFAPIVEQAAHVGEDCTFG